MNVIPALVLVTVPPESILGTPWFAVLSTFVAINTILYVSMSIFKILPKPYLSDVVRRHGRRAKTRSIYPDGRNAPDDSQRRGGMAVHGRAAHTTIDQELIGVPTAESAAPGPSGDDAASSTSLPGVSSTSSTPTTRRNRLHVRCSHRRHS